MAIQQHPLPQDISSYRFRLIGDMTLKQFASLGICVLLAIISYSFPLPFFFKYPIVFFFLLLGVGMAFVPVQGRSLDVWIIAFIKSIYSPTQYTWKKAINGVNAETSAPTKENNLASTQPVTNPSPQITLPPQAPEPVEQTASPVVSPLPETPPTPAPTPPVEQKEEILPVTPVPTSSPTPSPKEIAQAPAPTVNLPIPFTPTTPNTLVGLTLTPTGHILDGVMVEIKKDQLTLRATKSNKLGQFMFARPLDSGLFQILAEKEGFTFDPYSLQLEGDIVKPLKIQAKNI